MLRTRVALFAATLTLVGGCQNVGPISIDQGRDRYNSIIQSTSKQQTFENIIRVAHHEPTVFMDVTEVDATTSFTGSVTGGLAGIGAHACSSGGTLAGQTGAVAGGVTYSESPLVRYQPLLGQALVAQLATPVSPDVISELYGSAWDIAPLLDFSTAFLTLDSDEFYAALNTMAELDEAGRLQLVAEKSDVAKAKDETASSKLAPDKSGSVVLQVTNKSGSTGATDALVIYKMAYHPHNPRQKPSEKNRQEALWRELLRLYLGTQQKCLASNSAPEQSTAAQDAAVKAAADAAANAAARAKAPDAAIGVAARTAAQAALENVRPTRAPNPPRCQPRPTDSIEVRTTAVTAEKLRGTGIMSGAPMMRTNSAFGILKTATQEPHPRVAFVSGPEYLSIKSYPWNDPTHEDHSLSHYTLCPVTEIIEHSCLTSFSLRTASKSFDRQESMVNQEALVWLTEKAEGTPPQRAYLPPNPGKQFDDFVQVNRRLGHLSRYILIITGDTPPPGDAFVAYFDHGKWYYIDGHDSISQKNFDLISLFMTMMAVPSTTPPLAPVISAGGGG
jgi:hypothetical protein